MKREFHASDRGLHTGSVGPGGVTVAIACYNHGRFLERCIKSVLAQTQPAGQIIVVDDGSTDRTPEIAQGFEGVHYVFQKNAGLSAARNKALSLAREPRILFLDADDWLTPVALEAASAAFESSLSPAFVHGSYAEVSEDEKLLMTHVSKPAPDPFLQLLRGNYVAMLGTVLFDTELLRSSGGFDQSLISSEDYDVLLRLARRHAVVAYPEIAANYRRHGQTLSRNRFAMLGTGLRVIDRHLSESPKTAPYLRAARDGRRLVAWYYAQQLRGDLRQAQLRQGLFRALAALPVSAVMWPRAAGAIIVRVGAAVTRAAFSAKLWK